MINHAAAVYWHYLEVQGATPAKAWVAARNRSAIYYARKMRGGRWEYLRETRVYYLQDPILGSDGDTYMDHITAIAQDTVDVQRLDWLSQEDLVATLIEGHQAAGIKPRYITRSLNQGAIHKEATTIHLAAQGHTNAGIATLLDTTEDTIKALRQRIRRWLTALAEQRGVTDEVESWNKSGGNPARAVRIQGAYPGGTKPK